MSLVTRERPRSCFCKFFRYTFVSKYQYIYKKSLSYTKINKRCYMYSVYLVKYRIYKLYYKYYIYIFNLFIYCVYVHSVSCIYVGKPNPTLIKFVFIHVRVPNLSTQTLIIRVFSYLCSSTCDTGVHPCSTLHMLKIVLVLACEFVNLHPFILQTLKNISKRCTTHHRK